MEGICIGTGVSPRLPNAFNVRDLGGLPTSDGLLTRRGRLLRGDLAALLDLDLETLVADTGLRTVVDLRTRSEVHGQPGLRQARDLAWIHCPFRLGGFGPVPGATADFAAAYIGFLDSGPEAILRAARTLMAPSSAPALFHCAAGKDRTGVLAALLLDTLGVEHGAIAADYELTSPALRPVLDRLVAFTPYDEMLAGLDAAAHLPRAETMLEFLELLDRRYGGGAAWLIEQGLDALAIEDFRASMLVDAALPGARRGSS